MGVKVIKDAFPNAKIAVHRAESSEINDSPGKMNCDILSLFQMEPLIRSLSKLPKVDILLEDNFNLSVLCNSNSSESEEIILQKKCLEQWKVIHTPGHSPGSVCYYNEEMQILISGDTLFDYGGYGRTDMTGGDESLLRKSLNKLGQIIKKGTKVYPGHDSFGFSF
jgi:glyoxylase-like metal-dependent hydrolase (beta-lactamase superfamily II)